MQPQIPIVGSADPNRDHGSPMNDPVAPAALVAAPPRATAPARGFVGGFTAEAVYHRLRDQSVARTAGLTES